MLALHALSVVPLVCAYKPDDGTDGYTPYFYQMDVPVLVTNTISYGRAWQLLRSRGSGSKATGPCDPPQLASSCNCSAAAGSWPPNVGVRDDHDVAAMPRCVPSAHCDAKDEASPLAPPQRVAILLVLDMQRHNMRFPFGYCDACLRRAYGNYVRLTVRFLISLRRTNSSLPVHVLASGERSAGAEAKLAELFGVKFLAAPAPSVPVPEWASKWARGSFARLRALWLTQYTRLLLVDTDAVVLRPIDHLARVPAPAVSGGGASQPAPLVAPDPRTKAPTPRRAHVRVPVCSQFVFAWKCFPRRELRASTMVLAPDRATFDRALRLAANASTAVYDDLAPATLLPALPPCHRRARRPRPGYPATLPTDLLPCCPGTMTSASSPCGAGSTRRRTSCPQVTRRCGRPTFRRRSGPRYTCCTTRTSYTTGTARASRRLACHPWSLRSTRRRRASSGESLAPSSTTRPSRGHGARPRRDGRGASATASTSGPDESRALETPCHAVRALMMSLCSPAMSTRGVLFVCLFVTLLLAKSIGPGLTPSHTGVQRRARDGLGCIALTKRDRR